MPSEHPQIALAHDRLLRWLRRFFRINLPRVAVHQAVEHRGVEAEQRNIVVGELQIADLKAQQAHKRSRPCHQPPCNAERANQDGEIERREDHSSSPSKSHEASMDKLVVRNPKCPGLDFSEMA